MIDAIICQPRGVGRGGGWASLVTGQTVDFGPDLAIFVKDRSDAYRLVDWVTPPLDTDADPKARRVDRALVAYRDYEPQWLQVKLIVEQEHEEVLQRIAEAVSLRDGYLDKKLLDWAIDPANVREPRGYTLRERFRIAMENAPPEPIVLSTEDIIT